MNNSPHPIYCYFLNSLLMIISYLAKCFCLLLFLVIYLVLSALDHSINYTSLI
uniref:Uncharacterized protein n=1 Tax=Octopus bimaculoides TaxID=37653 RepID=A0A0L8G637_OCTBM